MTPEEVAHDRLEMQRAIDDPEHPWNRGATLLRDVIAVADPEMLQFLKAIAPYAFDDALAAPPPQEPS